ncbi:hypothetical protein KEM52_004073, partial [Ascosphaera acerosa]
MPADLNFVVALDDSPDLQLDESVRVMWPLLQVLTEPSFAHESICKKDARPLSTPTELIVNTLWRFLSIRGYIGPDHRLTSWGRVLVAALGVPCPQETPEREFEEQVLLAIELLRLGQLNDADLPPGTPADTDMTEADKRFVALVSRAATVGKLRHREIGYSGPLSQAALAFQSHVAAARGALRGLLEVVLANALLAGDADRDSPALAGRWGAVARRLPLAASNDAGLGLVIRTYLESLHIRSYPGPTSMATQAFVRDNARRWFHHVDDLEENLQRGFALFDAVYQGV